MTPPRPTLLLTRPRAPSEAFAAQCRVRLRQDWPILVAPLLSIRFLECPVDPAGFAAIIATSAHAIEALAQQGDLAGQTAFCVGDSTASAAIAAGMQALSAAGDAADLIDLVRSKAPAGPLLYARGAVVSVDLAAALGKIGITVQSAIVYRQEPSALLPEAAALLGGEVPVVLPLFSTRSAALAGQAMSGSKARLHIVAISRAVAAGWGGPVPASLAIAGRPDTNSMIELVVRACDGASS